MRKVLLLTFAAIILSGCLFGLFDKTPKGFVFVEGGQFTMSNDYSITDTFQVQISPYYLAKNEVSMADIITWANSAGIGENGYYKGFKVLDQYSYERPYTFQDSLWIAHSVPNHRQETASAIFISWHGACLYCNWLSNCSGRDSVYSVNELAISADHSKNGYRLPTEAEWEYAAREGAQSDNLYSGTNNLDSLENYAWYYTNAYFVSPASFEFGVHPSGEKLPNGLGLYDMSGNVIEWTWDWYSAYPLVACVDPMGPSFGGSKSCRGGSWNLNDTYCKVLYRISAIPSTTYWDLGFRMAVSINEE